MYCQDCKKTDLACECGESAAVGLSTAERVVMPAALDISKLLNSRCSYCGEPAQGNYSIHRDGFGIGPEVPLCNSCGAHTDPSEEVIWAKISEA
mgnify:CR=1 FL=1